MNAVLAAARQLAGGIAIVANAVGTLMVLLLVAVVNYDATARSLFDAPFHGAVEVVQFSMVLIVFLQLPDVCRVDRLTRSDGLLTVAGRRHPRLVRAARRVIDAVSALFMALIAVALWPEFVEMYASNDYFGVPGVFTAPWWPLKLTIFASATLCALLFLLKALDPMAAPRHQARPRTASAPARDAGADG